MKVEEGNECGDDDHGNLGCDNLSMAYNVFLRQLQPFSGYNCYFYPLMQVVGVSEILIAKPQTTRCKNPTF